MRWKQWGKKLILASALAGIAGCADTNGPVSPPPPPPTPRTNQLPTLIASTPVPSVAPSAPFHMLVHNAPPQAGLVYVSLPPGSVPAGLTASIRDEASGQVVAAAVVDGGFDPVAITATVGDTLLVSVRSLGSVSATLGYLIVPAIRPPVVVRTSPPPRKVDVPLNAFMVAVFNGPLDPVTVNSTSVTLWRGSTPVPGTIRFADAEHLRVEFHPDTLLAGQTDYQLILGNGIHDVNGVALDSAVTVTFTTNTTPPASGLVFASASAGTYYACGVTTAGNAYCWGDNSYGQLGNGTRTGSPTPVPVAGGLTFATVSANLFHTCGVTTSGAAYCWGSGMLGDGGDGAGLTPVPVAGKLTFASVSTGYNYSCGVTTVGVAYCWGFGAAGELGIGATEASTPVAVAGGLTFASVSAGGYHTCGVTTVGAVYCWGMNTLGELGIGTTAGPEQCQSWNGVPCSAIPIPVAGGLTFATVSSGALHSCGMTTSGAAYCWGDDVHDILGSGENPFIGPEQCTDVADLQPDWYPHTNACSRVPRVVGGGLVLASLSTGGAGWFACGLTSTGVAYCWGTHDVKVTTTAPLAVAGGQRFKMLSAGEINTCGVTVGGVTYCWGANLHGELGDGTTSSSSLPVKVAGQP